MKFLFINFTRPFALVLLFAIPIIIALYSKTLKKKRAAAMKFSNIGFIKSAMGNKKFTWRKNIIFTLSIIIITLMIIGFSNPHIPLKQTKEGVNVVLALDVSGSMQATDYQPNRLEAAKRSAKILLESLDPKDHAGIVLFESGATTSAYLSPFKDKVIEKLEGIAMHNGRTAIGDGLALAIDMATSIPNKKNVVILLSDGVSNSGVISPQEAISYANVHNIQVNTIGLGSTGEVVLGYDWFGTPQYAELDEATLINIAKQTGGKYFKSVDDDTLNDIYDTISKEIEREKEPTNVKNYFFAVSLVLLLVQLYIQYGKYRVIS